MGTSNTVSRALRLIGESGLEDGGVETLAERLGVGSRHLRRLFIQHLGAPPITVAQTRRLHFAKKLIDETRLPMGQVALAAGFGCVRRFNAAISKTYHRTPSQIRHIARQTGAEPHNQYVFHLRFRPPYNWKGILVFLAARATPGVEVVEQDTYLRSISVNGIAGYFAVSLDQEHNSLTARIQFPDPRSLFFIVDHIRAMFDLNADWTVITRVLKTDPTLAPLLASAPGLRVPGCWNGFELVTRAILGQQITVRGATTLAGRIVRAFGQPFVGPANLTHLFPQPETLADADLSNIGLPTARRKTIHALARAVCDGRIRFEGIVQSETFLEQLTEIPGIGKWTAQYVAMRALGEPDAFPAGDVALLSALNLKKPADLEPRSAAWRPWRAYATMYLWSAPHERAQKTRNSALCSPMPRVVNPLRTSRTSSASEPMSPIADFNK
jgi:AraC family transcriptional regulator of adaptative response / DNA-3-methyladenine glycosylase II